MPLLGDSAEEYHALKSAVDSLKQSHKRLSGAVEAKHFVAFKNVLNTVTKLMNRLEPLTVGMADAMVDLSSRFNKALDSKPIRNFLDMVNRDAVPIFKTMATAFGHFGIAAINIFTALSPMTKAIASGFGAMAERVATWSESLRSSQGLINFMDFVVMNIPKLRTGFRDLTVGLVNMFSGFGPMVSDALSWFQRMAAGFREWATNLKDTNGFKQFVSYIYETAPKIGVLIGNIAKLFVNLGKGMAGTGSSVLDVANKILSFVNATMSANPQIGQMIAKFISMSGLVWAIGPAFLWLSTAFGTAIGTIGKGIVSMSKVGSAIGVAAGAILGLLVVGLGLINQQFGVQMTELLTLVTQKGPEVITNLVNGITSALPALMASGAQLIAQLATTFATMFPLVVQAGVDILTSLISGLGANIGSLISSTFTIVTSILTSLLTALPQLVVVGMQFVSSLVQGVLDNIPQIISSVQTIVFGFVDSFVANLPTILDLGIQIITNLVDGAMTLLPQLITVGAQAIVQIVQGIAQNIPKIANGAVQLSVNSSVDW